MAKKTVITISEMETFCSCRLKHSFAYLDNLVPLDESIKAVRGTIVHRAIPHLNKHNNLEETNKFIVEEIKKYPALPGLNEREMQDLMKKYNEFNQQFGKEYVYFESEKEFCIPLPEIYKTYFAGAVDELRMKGGEIWIVEYKTKANLTAADAFKTTIDKQPAGYVFAMEKVFKKKIAGVCYITLLFPDDKIKDRVGWYEKKDWWDCVKVDYIIYPESDITRFLKETTQIVKSMRSGEIYRRPSRDCSYFCGYKSLCIEQNDDTIKANFKKKEKKHIELKGGE